MKLAILNGKPEIFYSIQGEGKNNGKPSLFIRLSNCNLSCYWCDTAYTWNWSGSKFQHRDKIQFNKSTEQKNFSCKELINIIRQFDCKNIIITGGEPLLQQYELIQLTNDLKLISKNYFFEIETNGTIFPKKALDDNVNQYNVSIKLKNSLNQESKRIKKRPIHFFSNSKKSTFKFVYGSNSDEKEILDLKNNFNIPNEIIYIMPEGVNTHNLKVKYRDVLEFCLKNNFYFTNRSHILLFGKKRGV